LENLIIAFDSIGEATLYVVDDKTYDILFELYENQKDYSEMMEEFWKVINELDYVKTTFLQWNSHHHFTTPITFKRILQVLQE
jgi:hypothetical protein